MWEKASLLSNSRKRSSWESRGASLIEVMIGVVLLAVGALVVSMLATQGHFSTNAEGGSSECRERAEYVVNIFKQADNKANVSNWVPSGLQTAPPAGYNHPERFSNVPAIYPLQANVTAVTSIAPGNPNPDLSPLFNTWELIDSGTNWALSLYAKTHGFCITPPSPGLEIMASKVYSGPTGLSYTSSGTLVPPGNLLPDESEYLNIQLFDLSKNQVDPGGGACPPVGNPTGTVNGAYANPAIIPLGINNTAGANAAGEAAFTNSGLKVTSTITYTDAQGNPQQCAASAILRPDGDAAPPAFVKSSKSALATTICPPPVAGFGQLCAGSTKILDPPIPPVNCQSSALNFYIATNEAGSAFLCQLWFTPNNTTAPVPGAPIPTKWAVCNNPASSQLPINPVVLTAPTVNTIAQVTGMNSNTNSATSTDFTLQVTGTGGSPITPGYYELFVRAWDSAQNQSAVDGQILVQQSAAGAYTSLTIIPPTPLIGATNTGSKGSTAFTTAEAAATLGAFGVTQFQCVAPSVTADDWQVTTVPAGAGAIYTIKNLGTGASLAPSACSYNPPTLPNYSTPVGTANGSYTITAAPCDICSGPAPTPIPGSSPFAWVIDLAPGPSPGASPVGANGDTFVQGPGVPGWALAAAEPSPIPYGYACEYPQGTFNVQTTTCAPAGFAPKPCSDEGGGGFCIIAYDGCGRSNYTGAVNYEVLAAAGQNCGNVACQPGLLCGLSPATLGTCVASVACAKDADCGAPSGPTGHICFGGTCDGVNAGPVSNPGTPLAGVCPSLNSGCGADAGIVCSVPPPPVPSPSPASSPVGSPAPIPSPTPALTGCAAVCGSSAMIASNCMISDATCPASDFCGYASSGCSLGFNECFCTANEAPGAACGTGANCSSGVCISGICH